MNFEEMCTAQLVRSNKEKETNAKVNETSWKKNEEEKKEIERERDKSPQRKKPGKNCCRWYIFKMKSNQTAFCVQNNGNAHTQNGRLMKTVAWIIHVAKHVKIESE